VRLKPSKTLSKKLRLRVSVEVIYEYPYQILVVSALMSVLFPASAIQLVTKEEMIRSQKAPPVVEAAAAPADPLAPQITLVDPETNGADKVVRNPFKMEVIFKPQEGAALDFKSFRTSDDVSSGNAESKSAAPPAIKGEENDVPRAY